MLYCTSDKQSEAMIKAAKDLGLTAKVTPHDPPDPRDAGIKHSIAEQLAATNEATLEHIVQNRYQELIRRSTRWECEAESDESYFHFEGAPGVEEQTAIDYEVDDAGAGEDTPEEAVLARVSEAAGYGQLTHDEPPVDDEWPRGRGRLAAFLDDDD